MITDPLRIACPRISRSAGPRGLPLSRREQSFMTPYEALSPESPGDSIFMSVWMGHAIEADAAAPLAGGGIVKMAAFLVRPG